MVTEEEIRRYGVSAAEANARYRDLVVREINGIGLDKSDNPICWRGPSGVGPWIECPQRPSYLAPPRLNLEETDEMYRFRVSEFAVDGILAQAPHDDSDFISRHGYSYTG
jgi:hypothetical protein